MHQKAYISELLVRHDCVIIPGLGGFVGSYYPASIHPKHHSFHPPFKKILFNSNLRHNDGLLADHVARAEGLTFSEANEQVRQFAEACLQALREHRPVLIREVGRLFSGQEGTIHFEQDMRFNLLAGSFGLQPFISIPVRAASEWPAETAEAEPAPEIRTLARKAVMTPLRWAAVLALPIGVAVMLSLTGYDKIRAGAISYADILSSLSERLSPFSTPDGTTSLSPKTKVIPVKPVTKPQVAKVEPAAPSPPPPAHPAPVPTEITPEEASFAVIIGAFRVEENATHLISALNQQGTGAVLFDKTKGGLFRVASGLFQDRDQALLALQQARTNGYPGAWLLSK